MRILVLSQYYPPEIGATQTRVHTLARNLAQRGHEVDVLCEVPNHPQGIVHDGFRRPVVRRTLDGVRVRYLWVKTNPVKTTRSRLEFYGSYAAMATLAGAACRRPDVVFASSPPLPVAAAAATVAGRHRVPWVFDVRDLWPEAAAAMGELSNPRLLRLMERLANGLYENAAAITAVTEPFRGSIADRVSRPEKVSLLPNGTTRFWVDGAGLEVDRGSINLPHDRFVWTYAGNVGAAQGLETAVSAAGLLANEGFQLLILGDGPAKAGLEAQAQAMPNAAVDFRPQVEPAEALRHLRGSDALLVPLAPDPALSAFVPSKLFDCCAAGRPVIVAAAGEPTRLAGASGAALPVAPGDPHALAAALRRLRDDPELRAALVVEGKRFGREHVRDAHAAQLERVLEGAMTSGAGSG